MEHADAVVRIAELERENDWFRNFDAQVKRVAELEREVARLKEELHDAASRFGDIEAMHEAKGYESNYASASRNRIEKALGVESRMKGLEK